MLTRSHECSEWLQENLKYPKRDPPVTLIHVSNPTKKKNERFLLFRSASLSTLVLCPSDAEQVEQPHHNMKEETRPPPSGFYCAKIILNMRAGPPCPGDYPP